LSILNYKINMKTIFISFLVLHFSFYIFGLWSGLTIFNFADQANTDGAAYYKIALNPFSDPPVDAGFRYATFLYPLITYIFAQGDPNITAIVMEIINIIAFSASISLFYKIVKDEGYRMATIFYAFNPIMLISTHGVMNEPLFFALIFGSMIFFKEKEFLKSAIVLSFACLARPDFAIFVFPFFLVGDNKKFLKFMIIPVSTLMLHGTYLVSRFGLEHFLRFTSGVESGYPHSMLGIPFYTFFQNRFYGGIDTPMITGMNLVVNEIITWSMFFAVIASIYIIMSKRHDDKFSLYLLISSSIVQPAYSYFAGYFRIAALAPSIYKLPCIIFKGKTLSIISLLYIIASMTLLFGWFF